MPSLILVTVYAVVILVAFFAVSEIYAKYGHRADGTERSFVLYLLGALLCGYLGGVAGSEISANWLCSGTKSSTGCALGVLALVLPIFGALGIGAFALLWAGCGHREAKNSGA